VKSASSRRQPCAIGIDVGGTKTAAGIVDPNGCVLAKRVIPTDPTRGGEAVLQDVLTLAENLRAETERQGCVLDALGVGVCELVSPSGEVLSKQTIAWRGLPIREQLGRVAPALLEADSRAAAFCEARCGAGRPFRSFLYVTIGTGIGSSLVLDGVPWPGANGCSGTLATAPATAWCPHCDQLSSTVLEHVASGPALVERYNQQAATRAATAEAVLAAAQAADPLATAVVRTGATTLGSTIGLLVNVLDPEAVIIGGGLGTAPGLFWEVLQAAIRAHIWSELHRDLPLLQAAHAGDAGFIGAGLLALKSTISEP
jgi:glucokinase